MFIELQLSLSDNVHLDQLIRIIDNQDLNNIILVWVAKDFKTTMLDTINEKINLSYKNIHFLALEMNEKIIDYLQVLNNIFITQVIENLKILNEVENQFKVIEIFYRLQDENNAVSLKKKDETLDLNRKEHVIRCLLKELRREISYYPSIHRDKKLDNNNNVIVLAGGKSEINFFIGLNRKNLLYVEIRFGQSHMGKEIFKMLLEKEEEVNDKLDYLCEFDIENHKIGTYLYYANNKREVIIKRISRVVNKFIRLFTKYTFPNGAN